jgi:hypothetical protein
MFGFRMKRHDEDSMAIGNFPLNIINVCDRQMPARLFSNLSKLCEKVSFMVLIDTVVFIVGTSAIDDRRIERISMVTVERLRT